MKLLNWIRKGKFSSLWVYLALVFVSYNVLIKGAASQADVIIQCFLICFYYLSRICEALESKLTT